MSAPAVSAQSAIDAYLQSALADSEAFGSLSDLLLTENDSDMAGVLSSIESAGGTQDPAIYWALQMALADRFGAPKPAIADHATAQQAQQVYAEFGQGLRDYVDAVHTATQDYFGAYGVDSVTAYHGLNYPQAPDDLHFDMAAREAQMQLSGITVYAQDPAAVITGALASQKGLSPNLAHVIAAQQVPVSDIWSVNGDGSLRVLPSASDQPSLYVGWTADSQYDTWAPDPSIVSGLLEGPPDALGGESAAPPPPEAPTTQGTPEQPPVPPGDIYQQTWDYRQQLLDGVASAQQTMSDYYAPTLEQINAQMLALAKKIQDAQLNHEDVDPMWLARETSLAQLYVDIEDRMSQAGQQASDALNQASMQAAQLGVNAGTAQLNSLVPNLPALLDKAGVDTLFGQPSEQALQNMVGAGQDPNSPLNMAFGALGQAAIDLIKHGLFNGLALGQNPLTVASQLASDVQDMTLSRANAIARNEMLRSYRTANLMSFQENSDVVDGWVWVAALSTNTCAFCWAENGGFHSSDETLDSHVSCACVMVPVTGDWSSVMSDLEEAGLDESDLEDLGIDFSEIEDTTVDVPPGEELFAQQPPDVQQKVLGPGKYALYQNGDLALSDLVGHYHDEQWGGVGYEKSLKDLGFTPEDVQAAKAALEAKANEPVAPPTVEEIRKSANQLAQEAGDRVRAAEEEARQAIKDAEAERVKSLNPIQKIMEWLKVKGKMTAADSAWRAEIDAIDKRMLAQRIAQQKLERGAGPLTPEVEQAAKRQLEERYRQAKAERGVNPLTEEVQQIEARQREERLQRFKDHGPAFSAKSQPREPLIPLAVKKFETYVLTPEDKAFAASVREQVGPEGVLDHEQAIEIGRQIQERIANQTSQTAGWAQESADIRSALPEEWTDAQKAWVNHDKATMDAHGGVDFYSAPDAYQADYRAKTVAYLQEIRGDEGGLGSEQLKLAAGDEYVASQLQEAAKLLPSDWIKASNDLGEITPSKNRATNSDGWFIQDNSFETGNGEIALSYSKNRDELGVQTVALHELIHRMEVAVPQLGKMEQDFYRQRTAGEDYTRLTNGIGMRTKLDEWLDQYLGAEPLVTLRPEYTRPDGIQARTAVNYELLTNGVQMAMGHAAEAGKFAQDREFERFVLGSLAGVKARPMGEVPLAEGETGPARAARNPAPFHQVEEQGQRSFAAKKGATVTDAQFMKALVKAHQENALSIGTSEITEVRQKVMRETGMSQAEFDARLAAVHDQGQIGAYSVHLEPNEDVDMYGNGIHALEMKGKPFDTLIIFKNEEVITPKARETVKTAESGESRLINPSDVKAWTRGNAKGVPAIGYHFTSEQGEASLLENGVEINRNTRGLFAQGFFMYRHEAPADGRVYGENFVKVAVKMKNPYITDVGGAHALRTELMNEHPEWFPEPQSKPENLQIGDQHVTEELLRRGYDGYIVRNVAVGATGTEDFIIALKDENVRVINETAPKQLQVTKGAKPPTVATERVNVSPVKPPRVRTLTAEQQAKRDAADAIKAAKAATTITKRGEALEISQGDMSARVEPDPNLGGYRLTIGAQEARPAAARTGSVDLVGAGREMVNAIVGHVATDEEIASLIGAPSDAKVKVIGQMQRDEAGRLTFGVIEMTGPKGAYTARRVFRELPNGDKVVFNQNIEIKKSLQGQGLGTRILADQTSALRDLGFKEIQTYAKGRSEGGNGYYTWPRLGYDTPITPELRASIEESAPIPEQFKGYTRLSQFMETPEGQAWWKEHGVGVVLTFDLTPGSRSNQMLDAYLREKGVGASAGRPVTTEGATLARVNALLKERLGYPGAVKAGQIEPGPAKTAAEKKAYRESGVKNATKVSKSENALTFTRPDGQAVTVERDMVNGGYRLTVGGWTGEGLTFAQVNARLKAALGYTAPLSRQMLLPGKKPRQPKPSKKA